MSLYVAELHSSGLKQRIIEGDFIGFPTTPSKSPENQRTEKISRITLSLAVNSSFS